MVEEEEDTPEVRSAPQSRPEELRILEAILFASREPLDEQTLAQRLPEGVELQPVLAMLKEEYAPRGVNLMRIDGKWTFRTAPDLGWLLTREAVQPRKLSRAAIETLAVIAYHQPVTRAEIEDIRGVTISKGTLDVLLETGWVKPRGRRKVPGRPLTYGTTEAFISHFGLEKLSDLPGLEELKGSGMLEGHLPPGFSVPVPNDDPALREDEDPLEPGDLDLTLAPRVEDEEGDGEAGSGENAEAEADAEAAADAAVADDGDDADGADDDAEAVDGDGDEAAELVGELQEDSVEEDDVEVEEEFDTSLQDDSALDDSVQDEDSLQDGGDHDDLSVNSVDSSADKPEE